MRKTVRSEQAVFSDLTALCLEPGFIHSVAAFCFRDNVWGFGDELKADDILKRRGKELIRSDISTQIGLMITGPIDISLPSPATLGRHMEKAEELLDELHHALMEPVLTGMAAAMKRGKRDANPFASAAAMREPVFYGGESAYDFQYLDLARQKYANDAGWLRAKKGFDISEAATFAACLQRQTPRKLMTTLKGLRRKPPGEWTMLPGFIFGLDEVVAESGLSADAVRSIVAAFTDSRAPSNIEFRSLSDFNTALAQPLIRHDDNSFVLLQTYNLLEALYESPFYWMISDKDYRNVAAESRGRFTEHFTAERLRAVFGPEAVTENVKILDRLGGNTLGEIDVLVLFGTRAIIVQTKSKKLTIAARKGNDAAMKADFVGAVQDAYDQAKSCSDLLGAQHVLIDALGNQLRPLADIEVIIPVCVVSDHYPALAFQTRHFLAHKEGGRLVAPFVVDTFTIDVLCELLASPLYLLSYLERRALYNDRVHSGHELAVLGYHLRSNLWVSAEFDMVALTEDLAADVDVAMMVRRATVPGKAVPPGILLETRKGAIGRILADLERSTDPAKFDLGMMLLTLSGKTFSRINDGIELAARKARADKKTHDFTISVGEGSTGLTIQASYEPSFVARPALESHCERRKYVSRADTWFGLLIDPDTLLPRIGLELRGRWAPSETMDRLTHEMRPDKEYKPRPLPDEAAFTSLIQPLGRNDRCWCGSGVKYKKCHLETDREARDRRL